MSVLRKKFLFVVAVSVTALTLIQPLSAQNSGTPDVGKKLPPSAASAAADQKAADGMSSRPTSTPTDADRKADAAMETPNAAK